MWQRLTRRKPVTDLKQANGEAGTALQRAPVETPLAADEIAEPAEGTATPGAVRVEPDIVPPSDTGAVPAESSGLTTGPIQANPPGLGLWKMSLLLTGSAFCGGIAVVLWNRRLLTKMREVAPVARSEQQRRLWEDDL